MNDDILDDNPQFQAPDNFDRYPTRSLPNSTATLVLGICSIVGSFCYGVPGLICAIIALVISRDSVRMYRENPRAYHDWQVLNAGRICAYVGLSIGILFLLLIAVFFVFLGTAFYGASGGF
jgi:UPF0716 family protein affecting phage T7 exclusion